MKLHLNRQEEKTCAAGGVVPRAAEEAKTARSGGEEESEETDPIRGETTLIELHESLKGWIGDRFKGAVFPEEGSKGWRAERQVLRDLAGVFGASAMAACLEWIFLTDPGLKGGGFWADQVQSVRGLARRREGETLSNFAKIHHYWLGRTEGRPDVAGTARIVTVCENDGDDEDLVSIPGPISQEAVDLWGELAGCLAAELDEESYRTWVEPIRAYDLAGGVLSLMVPSVFFRRWVIKSYWDLFGALLLRVSDEEIRVRFLIVADVDAKGDLECQRS